MQQVGLASEAESEADQAFASSLERSVRLIGLGISEKNTAGAAPIKKERKIVAGMTMVLTGSVFGLIGFEACKTRRQTSEESYG